MADKPSKLKIADREFTSRLLVGTGKFASNELMRDALISSGTELVTVALRRADLSGKHDPFANILDFIDPKRFLLLPNTSGARNAYRTSARPLSCRSAHPSAATAASKHVRRSRSSSNRPQCPSSWTRDSARPVMPPKRWKWAPMRFSLTQRSPLPLIQFAWRK